MVGGCVSVTLSSIHLVHHSTLSSVHLRMYTRTLCSVQGAGLVLSLEGSTEGDAKARFKRYGLWVWYGQRWVGNEEIMLCACLLFGQDGVW